MARKRPSKKKRISNAAIVAALALLVAVVGLMTGTLWYLTRPCPVLPPTPPALVDTAKMLARESEARLSLPPLDSQGRLIDSGTSRGASGDVHYIVWGGYSDTGLILAEKAIEERWREIDPRVRVGIIYPDHDRDGTRVRMVAGVSEIPLVEFRMKRLSPPHPVGNDAVRPPGPPSPGMKIRTGKIAIIIDDIGNDLASIESLLALGVPLTYSVLPYAQHTSEVCARLEGRGELVMLHLPMEPESYPENDPGPGALLLSMSKEEIRKNTIAALSAVPGARGVNNHMGSAFTENREAMQVLLSLVKEQGLFFVDSRTTVHTVAFSLAREMGVRTGERRVFLDHEPDVGSIEAQLHRLADKAEAEGIAIGIGHPYPETITALQQVVPLLSNQGFEFVLVSEALK